MAVSSLGKRAVPEDPGLLVRVLRPLNELCRAVAPGGGKRRSSAAVYLEPWHEVQS